LYSITRAKKERDVSAEGLRRLQQEEEVAAVRIQKSSRGHACRVRVGRLKAKLRMTATVVGVVGQLSSLSSKRKLMENQRKLERVQGEVADLWVQLKCRSDDRLPLAIRLSKVPREPSPAVLRLYT
jgi:hypothetical protein